LYPQIGFASISIADHPLNNYDINYIGTRIITYHITYNANGGTGNYTGPEIVPGGTDTVLPPGHTGISHAESDFITWNTQTDGNGRTYNPGDKITLNNDITLYSQWTAIPEPSEPPETIPPETMPPETTPPETTPSETAPSETPISKPESTSGIAEQTKQNGSNTGDSNYMVLWISLLCISFIVIVILIWRTIRKERER